LEFNLIARLNPLRGKFNVRVKHAKVQDASSYDLQGKNLSCGASN
jgi:hypothetical protein